MYQSNIWAAIVVTLNFCNFGSALDTPARQKQINLFCSRLIRIFAYQHSSLQKANFPYLEVIILLLRLRQKLPAD